MNSKKSSQPHHELEANLLQKYNAAGGYKPNRQFIFKVTKLRSSIDFYCLGQSVQQLQKEGYRITCKSYIAIGEKQ